MNKPIEFNEADHSMANKLIELRVCLTRSLIIINQLADKIELNDAQKVDFVKLTNVVKAYTTDSADTTTPN